MADDTMTCILQIDQINEKERLRVGGKGHALAKLSKSGFKVPDACCITLEAYLEYVITTGLQERILLELHRKRFEDMRWEEIWDTSLRIRNLFVTEPIPAALRRSLEPHIEKKFGDQAVAVRSSAPGEDAAKTSFAGLHESYVNIRGTEAILDNVKLVWASLWSDRALLYRKELGLDAESSAMAVVVQAMVSGQRSGVVFGQSPMDDSKAVVESVYGLNQGLVDGTIEPDQWILDGKTGEVVSHKAPSREKALHATAKGVEVVSLPADLRDRAPLQEYEIKKVFRLAKRAEALFGCPQDVEWTFAQDELYALQSRPITTRSSGQADGRVWYLNLRRSNENLKELREKIEKDLLPRMLSEAGTLAAKDLSNLSETELAGEIESRHRTYEKWKTAYWEDCIPFAHGMRLFGQVYNDVVKPEDPFEFMQLLRGSGMFSVKRNGLLTEMADRIRQDSELSAELRQGADTIEDSEFQRLLDRFYKEFGDTSWQSARLDEHRLIDLLLEIASHREDEKGTRTKDSKFLEERFLSLFEEDLRDDAKELLDLARASYRLRDDDNIYLGKVEGQVLAALEEGKRRIEKLKERETASLEREDVVRMLKDPDYEPEIRVRKVSEKTPSVSQIEARQLVGQPAGPGIGAGKARVILNPSDLFKFKAGEILVCDAVDPNMTFVVPLCSGVVERRGGMLIHGAIIAREYGLPCVTGVPDLTHYVKTGDLVTVDGFLGLVIIGEPTLSQPE
jgi:pyruvate,water dikinase